MKYTTHTTSSITGSKRSRQSEASIGMVARELLKAGVNSSKVKGGNREVKVDRKLPTLPTLWITLKGEVEEVDNVNLQEFTLPLSFPWDDFMNDRIAFVKANLP